MFRATCFSIPFLVLTAMSLFGGRLVAEDAIEGTRSFLSESSVSFEIRPIRG